MTAGCLQSLSLSRSVLYAVPNLRLHADERLRGAFGAPPSLAGEPSVRLPEQSFRRTRGISLSIRGSQPNACTYIR